MPLTASLPVEIACETAMPRGRKAACSTVAMAPLCDTMPTLRRPPSASGALVPKVSAMPST